MKTVFVTICLASLATFLLSLTGCQTSSPGVKDTLGAYSVEVDAAPDKVTSAARSSVEDMKFADIQSAGTKVDGKVTAQTAQGDNITIDIEQAGDNVSTVTVRVGATGDQAISQQIIDRIKQNI